MPFAGVAGASPGACCTAPGIRLRSLFSSAAAGGARPTETILIDAVDANLVTTINTSDYRWQEIPDAWFQRDFLPRLKVD